MRRAALRALVMAALAAPVAAQDTLPDRPECDVCAARHQGMQRLHAARKAKEKATCDAQAKEGGDAADCAPVAPKEAKPQD